MRLSKIILIILVLLSLFVLIKTFTSKKETPVQNPTPKEEQVQDNSASEDKKKEPNALNVIAPYYNNTQKKVQSVQEIRQQTIKEEKELLGDQD